MNIATQRASTLQTIQQPVRAKLDKDTGKISAYAVKTVVETAEQVEDPALQITVEDARKIDPSLEIGGELLIPKVTEGILGRIAAQLAKQEERIRACVEGTASAALEGLSSDERALAASRAAMLRTKLADDRGVGFQ